MADEFDYGEAGYWDNRYEKEQGDNYDWLGGYSKFEEFIAKALEGEEQDKRTARILDLGCGNARLAEDMYDNGYTDITAVDLSEVVINDMKARNAGKRDGITWVTGDAFNLEFADESFDMVIDKSTTDAVSCDIDKRNENLVRMTAEVSRILRPGGKYLVFSAVNDVPRMSLSLPHTKFDWEETEIPMPFNALSVFVATKAAGADLAYSLRLSETLEGAIEADTMGRKIRQEAKEAEERLKNEAPTSFAVLD